MKVKKEKFKWDPSWDEGLKILETWAAKPVASSDEIRKKRNELMKTATEEDYRALITGDWSHRNPKS